MNTRRLLSLPIALGLVWLLVTPLAAQLGSLVVTITSPAPGSTVSATIPVNANVSVVGMLTVAGVQFKLDGANIGAEDTAAPYSIQWNTKTASNGSHTLTAVARDGFGVMWNSSPVNVTVFNDLTPPTVSITSPATGATIKGTISFAANASDNVGVVGVQFKIDGANLGAEDTAAPYAINWDTTTAASGAHTMTVVARDAAGNTTTSTAVSVTVDNAAPAVSVTSPANGAIVAGPISVTANATDNVAVAGVQFMLDGAALGAEDTAAPYAAAWNTAAATNGSHTLTAIARDGAGNTSTAASITVSVDNGAPVVSITSPAGGANVSGTVTVTANASDNAAVAGVQFQLDGAALGAEDTVAPYGVDWDTRTAANGSHTLSAVARDTAGNFSNAVAVTVSVVNDTAPPAVTITSPANGATVSGAVNITANATDDGVVAGVQFFVDGVALGAEDTTSPYAASWDTSTASSGSHALTAVARDGVGNTTTSAAVTVTVGNTVTVTRVEDNSGTINFTPAGTWNEPYSDARAWSGGTTALGFSTGQGATLNFTGVGITWIGFRGPQTGIAKVYLDGTLVATVDAYNATEIVQAPLYSASGLTNGPHTITIEVTRTKNDAASDYYVIVDAFDVTTTGGAPPDPTDTTPPTASITSPANGATVLGTIGVTATASDNTAVAGVQFFLDGAAVAAEDTTAPYSLTWDTTTSANGSHTLTARARDAAGNMTTSTAVTVTVANGAGSNVRIEDGNTAITYHGSWNVGNTSRSWSGGTAAIGFGTGQDAVVTFRGTGITWIGFRGPWVGIANVYVDGVFAASIDGYAAAEAVQTPVFTVSGLALGQHTLTIVVTRTKNAASSDFVVIVDAFDIIDAPADTTAPTISITTPANGATVFSTVPVGASADDDMGVSAVTFFVDGTQVGTTDTISPYGINWDTRTAADGSHTLTATARDAAGNVTTSAAVTVVVANAAPPPIATATRIENTDLGIIYVDGCATCGQPPSWFHGSRSRAWSDGTASFNRADGSRATYTFTGTAVKWIGFRAAWAGIARVFVDGAFVAEIDLFSPTEEVQVPVFQATGLVPGTHTIAVESTGRKNAEATDYAVVLDAFDVSPGMAPPVTGTRFEENTSSATFTPGWNTSDTSQAWSGGTAAVASAASERATFTFTGTAVNWIGKRGPDMGIARVYLDGALQAQVDSYYPSTIQGLVYTVTGLAPAAHRLEIEVTGAKNSQSTSATIVIDAFDVRSRIEEDDAKVAYTGTWTFNDVQRNFSDTSLTTGTGTASYSGTAGAHADLTFNGTAVTWMGIRAPFMGIANVYVDGVFAQQVDLYATTEQVQAPVFTASGLAPGSHTLRVEATGTKNAAAATTRVYIDFFDVTVPAPAPQMARLAETDVNITYSSGWAPSGTSPLWSGANAKETRTVGAQATLTFNGTAIRWIGERGFTTGLARVSVDGQFVGVVDTRTPFQERYQEPLFIATGLTAGAHTLTIEIAGRNNEAPGTLAERVVIDAFDIQQ